MKKRKTKIKKVKLAKVKPADYLGLPTFLEDLGPAPMPEIFFKTKIVKPPQLGLDVSLAKVVVRLTNELRWEQQVSEMLSHIEYALADQNDDVEGENHEAHNYLNELLDLFRICEMDWQTFPNKKSLLKYINGLPWENFKDDETGEYYSLGSMFYNKLQWIIELDEGSDAEAFAQNTIYDLPAFLDELERYANS